jgi:hypothetical protein
MIGFKTKPEAIEFLQVTEEEFDRYDSKSLILYTLKHGQRWYSEEVLCRFRDNVLRKRGEKK